MKQVTRYTRQIERASVASVIVTEERIKERERYREDGVNEEI